MPQMCPANTEIYAYGEKKQIANDLTSWGKDQLIIFIAFLALSKHSESAY